MFKVFGPLASPGSLINFFARWCNTKAVKLGLLFVNWLLLLLFCCHYQCKWLPQKICYWSDILNKCHEIADIISLQFNVCKCHCLVVGKMSRVVISPMILGSEEIAWSNHIKYLGIYLACGRTIKFDINPLKKNFLCCL